MADDRGSNPARTPAVEAGSGDTVPYKGLLGKKNIASVSRPSSGYEGSGGRIHVEEYNAEELGPREMTKFDKNNKYHVGMLTAKDDSNKGMMLHSGGYFSFPKKDATAKPEAKKAAPKTEGAPIAGTKSGAQARGKALAANEEKMAIARKKLAAKKNK